MSAIDRTFDLIALFPLCLRFSIIPTQIYHRTVQLCTKCFGWKDAIKSNSSNGGECHSLGDSRTYRPHPASLHLLLLLLLILQLPFGPLTHRGLARRQEVFTGSHAHQEATAIRTFGG